MTKAACRLGFMAGKTMSEMFPFGPGQECEIFKADEYSPGDEIIYIPDVDLNELYIDRPRMSDEDIEEALSCCYTGDDFLRECDGNEDLAKLLFGWVDWEHPISAMPDLMIAYPEFFTEED